MNHASLGQRPLNGVAAPFEQLIQYAGEGRACTTLERGDG